MEATHAALICGARTGTRAPMPDDAKNQGVLVTALPCLDGASVTLERHLQRLRLNSGERRSVGLPDRACPLFTNEPQLIGSLLIRWTHRGSSLLSSHHPTPSFLHVFQLSVLRLFIGVVLKQGELNGLGC
ncbi:hypothetical protein MTO96_000900 [Rhipicephalus appendiculatus]